MYEDVSWFLTGLYEIIWVFLYLKSKSVSHLMDGDSVAVRVLTMKVEYEYLNMVTVLYTVSMRGVFLL